MSKEGTISSVLLEVLTQSRKIRRDYVANLWKTAINEEYDKIRPSITDEMHSEENDECGK